MKLRNAVLNGILKFSNSARPSYIDCLFFKVRTWMLPRPQMLSVMVKVK